MTESDKTKKIDEYSSRHQFWRDKILTQLGYSINLFLTIGFGLIAFLVSQKDEFTPIEINLDWELNWNLILYLTTVLLTSLSILLGAVSVTRRLFDLRITSHITLVRKKAVEKNGKLLPGNPNSNNKKRLLHNYFSIMFLNNEQYKVKDEDYNDEDSLINKFKILRSQTDQLGNLVWISHKLQIWTILIAVLLYGLTLIT